MSHFDHVVSVARSDVGRKRKNNEDAFGVFHSGGFWCVSDGMGGGDDGEIASAATVREVENFMKLHPLLEEGTFSLDWRVEGVVLAVQRASSWIFRRAQEKHLRGCGATFVGFALAPENPAEAMALHAGDSRLYRIRGKAIRQITTDHSAAGLIGAKDDADVNPMFRGMVLRAVGVQPSVDVERTAFDVKAGDCLLLCSDGLSRMVPDERILEIVHSRQTVKSAVDALIDAANEAGGIDNVTAVLVEIGELPPAAAVCPNPISLSVGADEDTTSESFSFDTQTDAMTMATMEFPTEDSDTADSATMATVTIAEEESTACFDQGDDVKARRTLASLLKNIWSKVWGRDA